MTDESSFRNTPIDVVGLPRLADAELIPLDPAYLRLRMMGSAIAAVVVVAGAVVLAVLARPIVGLVTGAVALAFVAFTAWLRRLEVAHMGYVVRPHDVTLFSGVLSRTVATVPFARVQHVSIERGPLDRRYDLASLDLRTAGGSISIPGLLHDDAGRLKQLVADRAGELATDEIDDPAFDTPLPAPMVPPAQALAHPLPPSADDER